MPSEWHGSLPSTGKRWLKHCWVPSMEHQLKHRSAAWGTSWMQRTAGQTLQLALLSRQFGFTLQPREQLQWTCSARQQLLKILSQKSSCQSYAESVGSKCQRERRKPAKRLWQKSESGSFSSEPCVQSCGEEEAVAGIWTGQEDSQSSHGEVWQFRAQNQQQTIDRAGQRDLMQVVLQLLESQWERKAGLHYVKPSLGIPSSSKKVNLIPLCDCILAWWDEVSTFTFSILVLLFSLNILQVFLIILSYLIKWALHSGRRQKKAG